MLVSETPPQYGAKIEQVVGMYDYLLGTFYYGPNGISQFKSTILDINTTVAQDPESGQYELAENKIKIYGLTVLVDQVVAFYSQQNALLKRDSTQ